MTEQVNESKVNDALRAYLALIRAHKKFYKVRDSLNEAEKYKFATLCPLIPIPSGEDIGYRTSNDSSSMGIKPKREPTLTDVERGA